MAIPTVQTSNQKFSTKQTLLIILGLILLLFAAGLTIYYIAVASNYPYERVNDQHRFDQYIIDSYPAGTRSFFSQFKLVVGLQALCGAAAAIIFSFMKGWGFKVLMIIGILSAAMNAWYLM